MSASETGVGLASSEYDGNSRASWASRSRIFWSSVSSSERSAASAVASRFLGVSLTSYLILVCVVGLIVTRFKRHLSIRHALIGAALGYL